MPKAIYITRDFDFNFRKCSEYLFALDHSKRNYDLIVFYRDLISKFGDPKYVSVTIDILKEILKTIISDGNSDNLIEFSSESIIFKRNIEEANYEYIANIIREKNEPMYFKDVYTICRNRGIKTSEQAIRLYLKQYPNIFGSKGSGYIGLKEWGGYFGTIGDVAEQYLMEKEFQVSMKELRQLLVKELHINSRSVSYMLF